MSDPAPGPTIGHHLDCSDSDLLRQCGDMSSQRSTTAPGDRMIERDAIDDATPVKTDVIWLSSSLHERLLTAIHQRHPRKSFGYLVSDEGSTTPQDFVLFDANVRNDPGWRDRFESYGTYFVEHPDAGFVASPEETWRRQKEIWARGMVEIAVFHSHR